MIENKSKLFFFLFSSLIIGFSTHTGSAIEYPFVNQLGMKFAYIKPGTFFMGSPNTELGRGIDEKLHKVTLKKGFYVLSTEVTQGQFYKVMKINPSDFIQYGPNYPVDNVTWTDCQSFIEKLNKLEGTAQYRLPTEAEWEYTCRAQSKTAFANGNITVVNCDLDPNLDKIGWYCGNSGISRPQTKNEKKVPVTNLRPHQVGTKVPNAWGLYDMHGNVSEWVLDSCQWRDWTGRRIGVITDTYKNGVIDPLSKDGTRKIFRGGSWNMSPKSCRSAYRGYYNPKAHRNSLGFRIIKER